MSFPNNFDLYQFLILVEALKDNEITDILTLCSLGELRKFRVPSLLEIYEGYGFTPHNIPITDGGIPTMEQCQQMFNLIKDVLESRGKLLIQ